MRSQLPKGHSGCATAREHRPRARAARPPPPVAWPVTLPCNWAIWKGDKMEDIEKKRGFLKRVRSGWFAGLQQLDPMICLETALLALIVASMFVSFGSSKARHGQTSTPPSAQMAAQPAVAPKSLPIVWSRPGTITLRKTPKSSDSAGAISLAAYTPLQVLEANVNATWLLVAATLPSGARHKGYVISSDVQLQDPMARMTLESGVLKVTRGGAATYLAPHAQAATTGMRVQNGVQLTLLGRVRNPGAVKAAPDFLLVENDRAARGQPRRFWISSSDVRILAPPR